MLRFSEKIVNSLANIFFHAKTYSNFFQTYCDISSKPKSHDPPLIFSDLQFCLWLSLIHGGKPKSVKLALSVIEHYLGLLLMTCNWCCIVKE